VELFAVQPNANVIPVELAAREGETAQFHCNVSGSPQPEIEWIKDEGRLTERHSIQAGILR